MAPHGSVKDEGSQEPPPITPGGTYNIQVCFLSHFVLADVATGWALNINSPTRLSL